MAEQGRVRMTGADRGGSGLAGMTVILVTLVTVLAAGASGALLKGGAAWGSIALIGVGAAVLSAFAARGSGGASKARDLVKLIETGGASSPHAPRGFAGEWASLYQRLNGLAVEARSSVAALTELERYRRQTELAVGALRGGKDPLVEVAELRVGPLRDLLEAAKGDAPAGPVVSRLALGEEELIGTGSDALPESWPRSTGGTAEVGVSARLAMGRDLDEIVHGLTDLAASFSGGDAPAPSSGSGAARTPAQLVDDVVHTAADGIEDLAAGLMRASELASVAERVTNRATLLALNAALEATRSGSEAFAAIAEETRRLAEFAREATDTISRLASEIEYKVGETITAIHATSEDAKSSLAQISQVGPQSGGPGPAAQAAVEALLRRARDLKRSLETSEREIAEPGNGASAASPMPPSLLADEDRTAVQHPTIDFNPAQDLVENRGPGADKLPTEAVLLIEGLQQGARIQD